MSLARCPNCGYAAPSGATDCPLCHGRLGETASATQRTHPGTPVASLADRIAAMPEKPARRAAFRIPDRLDSPIWPFVWIVLAPVALYPVHAALLALVLDRGCTAHVLDQGTRRLWECPDPGLAFGLPWVPGILALAALVWLGARRSSTRVAFALAALVGSALVAVPLALVLPFLGGRALEYHQVGFIDGVRSARGPAAFGTFGYTGWVDIRLWTLYLWAATVGLTLLVAAFTSLFAATQPGRRR